MGWQRCWDNMRWAIVLLLLANVIMFAWYSQSGPEVQVGQEEDKGPVQLLAEVDATNLLRRNEQASSPPSVESKELTCAVIGGCIRIRKPTSSLKLCRAISLKECLGISARMRCWVMRLLSACR